MIKNKTTLLVLTLSLANAYAECTYQQAQTKMIEVNNMAQIYNREMAAYVQKGEDSPATLEKKRLVIAEESATIGLLMAKAAESYPKIQPEDTVNADICQRYEAILKTHQPKGYQGKKVRLGDESATADCNSSTLWTRYGKAIQQQSKLVESGRITKKEVGSYMTLATQIGELATTDLPKACKAVSEFEKKLAKE